MRGGLGQRVGNRQGRKEGAKSVEDERKPQAARRRFIRTGKGHGQSIKRNLQSKAARVSRKYRVLRSQESKPCRYPARGTGRRDRG